MNIQKAIERMKQHKEWGFVNDTQDAIDLAIEALEKQNPKKPIDKQLKIYSGGTQKLNAYCPICKQPVSIYNGHQNNKVFRRDEDVFCSHCGQALDWSDSDEEH